MRIYKTIHICQGSAQCRRTLSHWSLLIVKHPDLSLSNNYVINYILETIDSTNMALPKSILSMTMQRCVHPHNKHCIIAQDVGILV